ncbi:MAG: lysozyme inhibitor LprI family protein [Gammaproteobacteria bacterium]|nr:lysozyme inhibitor LprI family protein [Gammaproteobacteria bacterium]
MSRLFRFLHNFWRPVLPLVVGVTLAGIAHADPYANGEMAKLAQHIWAHPKDNKAVKQFLVGQWEYVGAAGFPKRKPGEKVSGFREGLIIAPSYFIGRRISFFPNQVDQGGVAPGLTEEDRCGPPRYFAKKEVYVQYEVPPKTFVQTSLYDGGARAIAEELPSLADAVQPFKPDGPQEVSGWIFLKMDSSCVVAPGKKREKLSWSSELSREGYLVDYFMDGWLVLKKISNDPGPYPPGSIDCGHPANPAERTVCATPALRRLDGLVAKAYRRFEADSMRGSPDRQALVTGQRQWHQNRDACTSDVGCLQRQYQKRLQALRQGYLDQYEKARKAAEAH